MKRLKTIVLAILVAADWRRKRKEREEPERIVPEGEPDLRAENVAILLLLASALCALGFVAIYIIAPLHDTQWMGLTIGLALALLAAALIVIGKRLVVEEHEAEEYPPEHVEAQEQIVALVDQSGSRITRKRLLGAAGGVAATALGAALAAPAVSLGPVFDTGSLYETPWKRGRRLVDSDGRPMLADDIEEDDFYTAYPEGADRDSFGAPLVLVRLPTDALALPRGRGDWAPEGILAYSKICTHAGCAISLYRTPKFAPTEPGRALVCPCHYSTFDPAKGASVEFGPAGRPLPQLPLMIDAERHLRAAGNFSAPVGPGWWGLHLEPPR
jgi:ubiquinol-cytochrome c reductase iron-sulfur subunit